MASQEPLKDLEVVQTDTKNWCITFKHQGVPVDITGYILFFTAKNKLTDLDTAAVLKKTYVCPSNADSLAGKGFITLSSTDTNIAVGNYCYDMKYQVNSGVDIALRKTLAIGNFRVNATGTKRTS